MDPEIQKQLDDAMIREDIAAVKCLIEQGADVNALDEFGDSILATSCLFLDNPEFRYQAVELLLKHGADPKQVDQESTGPLFNAVIVKDTRLVKLLLDHGADPNTENMSDETLYDWAEFDYRYDEYRLELPEEPTVEDGATEEQWLHFLDRLAIKYGKRRPDYLFLLRAAGAKTWRELETERAAKESDQGPSA